jgi:hypothetical protein
MAETNVAWSNHLEYNHNKDRNTDKAMQTRCPKKLNHRFSHLVFTS